LQCYADMFCRFIDLYAEQGLPITKVMYQNEAYSYTPLPWLCVDSRGHTAIQQRLSGSHASQASPRSGTVDRHLQYQPPRLCGEDPRRRHPPS
jgi:hypothetical protein